MNPLHNRCNRIIADLESRNIALANELSRVRDACDADSRHHSETLLQMRLADARLRKALADVAALAGRDHDGSSTLAAISSALPECMDAASLPKISITVRLLGHEAAMSAAAHHFVQYATNDMKQVLVAPTCFIGRVAGRLCASDIAAVEARLNGRLEACSAQIYGELASRYGQRRVFLRVLNAHPPELVFDLE